MSHLQSYPEPTPVDDDDMFGEGPAYFSDVDNNNEESNDDDVISGDDEWSDGPYLSGYNKQYHNDNFDDNSKGNNDHNPLVSGDRRRGHYGGEHPGD